MRVLYADIVLYIAYGIEELDVDIVLYTACTWTSFSI